MDLTTEQKQQVAAWIEEGANLSAIQQRLSDQFDLRLTYMEARFLIDDLKLNFKEEPAAAEPPSEAQSAFAPSGLPAGGAPEPEPLGSEILGNNPEPAAQGGGVRLKVDSITRPGAMVSGSVTFSDGENAAWYLDQMGRLGLVAETPGYRPAPQDVAPFQQALEAELAKLGI
jgi:hypothetical protein